MKSITIHVVWFEDSKCIYSTGQNFTAPTYWECIREFENQFPTAIMHSCVVKECKIVE
jgi:hypothetical protein